MKLDRDVEWDAMPAWCVAPVFGCARVLGSAMFLPRRPERRRVGQRADRGGSSEVGL